MQVPGKEACEQLKTFIKVKSESGTEDVHYSSLLEYLPEEYKLIAEKELNETEESKKKEVRKIKAFLEKKHLACPDEDIIIWVLRNCKYDYEKAEKKIIKFLDIQKHIVDNVIKLQKETVETILDDMPFGILPYRDKYGSVIVFTKPTVNLNAYTLDEVMFVVATFMLFLLGFPMVSVTGIMLMKECKTPSLSIFYPLIKAYRRYLLTMLNFPMRFRKVEFFNENFLIRWGYNIMRPILPVKMTRRISFHGNGYESLQKLYSPNILPKEFEGTLGPLSDQHYRKKFLEFIEKLKAANEPIAV